MRPGLVADGWWLLWADRLPGPVLALPFLEVEACLAGRLRRIAMRPRGAHLHPGGEIGDDGIGQFAPGRHAQIDVAVADSLDETALVRLSGDEGGSVVAAGEGPLPAIEVQSAT